MRCPSVPSTAAALALALALWGCGNGPCQDLGERLCACDPGTTASSCERRVKDQLGEIDPSSAVEDLCQARLDSCNAPSGTQFCEWLLTESGKVACGLTPPATP